MQNRFQHVDPCPECGRTPSRGRGKPRGSIRRAARKRLARQQVARDLVSKRPAVLIVEYRDEVYARLAADLAMAGLRVTRAVDAATAAARMTPGLEIVIINTELPDQKGWAVAASVRAMSPMPRIWLYKAWNSPIDVAHAYCVRSEELLEYRGELHALSDAVLGCLAGPTAFALSTLEPSKQTHALRAAG